MSKQKALRSDKLTEQNTEEISTNNNSVSLENIKLADIKPAKINNKTYRLVDTNAPDIIELANKIKIFKLLDPLVITRDNVIISGHRRYAAIQRLGWTDVEVRRKNIYSDDADFEKILVAFNDQRIKNIAELVRESVINASKEDAYSELINHRLEQSETELEKNVELIQCSDRNRNISDRRIPFLNKIIDIINTDLNKYLPVSVRQIHYNLLNYEVYTDASNPKSKYLNNINCYRATSKILTDARISGQLPFWCVIDETRPVTLNQFYDNAGDFFQRSINSFLKGYRRNLTQSQPNHVEVIAEKLTVQSIIKPICNKYCLPCVIARGYSSVSTFNDTVERFKKSGKEELIILMLTDFDPEGEDMLQNTIKTIRELGVNPTVHKVGITERQFIELDQRFKNFAKISSSRAKKFMQKYGEYGAELEALPPAEIQELLRKSIEDALKIDLFKQEVELEKADSKELHNQRQQFVELSKHI